MLYEIFRFLHIFLIQFSHRLVFEIIRLSPCISKFDCALNPAIKTEFINSTFTYFPFFRRLFNLNISVQYKTSSLHEKRSNSQMVIQCHCIFNYRPSFEQHQLYLCTLSDFKSNKCWFLSKIIIIVWFKTSIF